jgi:hypothetical protein
MRAVDAIDVVQVVEGTSVETDIFYYAGGIVNAFEGD